ncbi:MAG: hypothetical protein WAK90_01710 [Pseudolabrys sp.]
MRNLVLGIVGLGVVALALPVASANAEETIVIKKHRQYNHDWDRHHNWDRQHKKVVVLKGHRDHDHDRYRE